MLDINSIFQYIAMVDIKYKNTLMYLGFTMAIILAIHIISDCIGISKHKMFKFVAME